MIVPDFNEIPQGGNECILLIRGLNRNSQIDIFFEQTISSVRVRCDPKYGYTVGRKRGNTVEGPFLSVVTCSYRSWVPRISGVVIVRGCGGVAMANARPYEICSAIPTTIPVPQPQTFSNPYSRFGSAQFDVMGDSLPRAAW